MKPSYNFLILFLGESPEQLFSLFNCICILHEMMIRETERKQLYSDLSSFATWARVSGPHYVLLLLVSVSNSYLRNFIFLRIAWFARYDNLSTLVVSFGFRSVCVCVCSSFNPYLLFNSSFVSLLDI